MAVQTCDFRDCDGLASSQASLIIQIGEQEFIKKLCHDHLLMLQPEDVGRHSIEMNIFDFKYEKNEPSPTPLYGRLVSVMGDPFEGVPCVRR